MLWRLRFVRGGGRRQRGPSHALRRPASEKRQGTKSREVRGWSSGDGYGDLSGESAASIVTRGGKVERLRGVKRTRAFARTVSEARKRASGGNL